MSVPMMGPIADNPHEHATPRHLGHSSSLTRTSVWSFWTSFAAGSIIVIYFLLLTHGGLTVYFTGDDVMNIAFLHGYGRVSIGIVLAQALAVFTPEYRPVGGVYYRTLYAAFGLHPLPFRIVFFTFLGVNLALAAKWSRQISDSSLTVAVAALLFSFHPALAELYFNDGTIYDVLCLFFVLLALLRYARIRKLDRFLSINNLLIVLVLYSAALGSKEMALTLPGVLILYEAIFFPGFRNIRERSWPVVVLAIASAMVMIWKVMVPNPMSTNINGGYTPRFQPAFIAHGYLHYYRQLFLYDLLSGAELAAILMVTVSAAIILRNRTMLFGFLFANLALFPVCVIPHRAGFVWYMPLLGWALCAGSAISGFVSPLGFWLKARVRGEWLRSISTSCLEGIFLALLATGLYAVHARHAATLGAAWVPEQQALKTLLAAARKASPSIPSGSRILLESDPFPEVSWDPLFLIRLGYGDPSIWVDRASHLGRDYNPNDAGLYLMRMRWHGSAYEVEVKSQSQEQPVPLAVTPSIVHRGHPVRVQFPVSFASCRIDVAYRMPEDELLRAGVWLSWTESGADGKGEAWADRDAERGLIVIDRVRTCGGDWRLAQGSFTIVP